MNMVKRIVASVALIAAGFTLGYAVHTTHNAPVCITVHSNGAPAPASCDDPNSYQVTR